MKRSLTFLFAIWSILSIAQVPAFPGAEGFGRYVTGGRGGKVYTVTTLEDNTLEGSLRYAINQSGARTIVFNVTGTIKLKEKLQINNDNITIAGQTSPGGGICLGGYPFVIGASNVIIRYMHFRMGDINQAEGDAMSGSDQEKIIVDHCSFSWSTDECLSVYGNKNTTIQWCMVSQSLRTSVHTKGNHGYGGIVGGVFASYHHNLLAHNDSRTPRLGPRPNTQEIEHLDMRNNVIYNWGGLGCYGAEGMKANIVNNYYKPGPATDAKNNNLLKCRIVSIGVRTNEYALNTIWAPMLHKWGKYFIDGNKIDGNESVSNNNWPLGVYAQTVNDANCDFTYTDSVKQSLRLTEPIDYGMVTTHTPDAAYEQVLKYAGCSLYRDKLDVLIVDDVRNRKATYGNSAGVLKGIIDSQAELMTDPNDPWSAWPVLVGGSEITDVDKDGIPDGWLQKKYPGKKPTDLNADGYTYLEVYLNNIVTRVTDNQNISPVTSTDKIATPKVSVYFNKSNRMLHIKANEGISDFEIYNIADIKIMSKPCTIPETFIEMSGFPNGIYFVRPIQNGKKLPSCKVMVG